MMLRHLDSRITHDIHWTEIYVILTVSAMLLEEARKVKINFDFWYKYLFYDMKNYYQYDTRMTERWGSTGSMVLTMLTLLFYITPYFLFYLGLIIRYSSYSDGLLSVTRFAQEL